MPNIYFDIERFVRAQDGRRPTSRRSPRFALDASGATGSGSSSRRRAGSGAAPWRSATASPAARSLTRTSTIPCSGLDFSRSRTRFSPCRGSDPVAVLGSIDALKVRSSMTLFELTGADPVFGAVLDKYYAGSRDELTLRIVNEAWG